MISFTQLSQLEKLRQQIPALQNKVYFNFGGQGTLPNCALDAIIEAHRYVQEQGPFSAKVNTWIQYKTQQLKEILAQELGATPQSITLTENVTAGCNIVLWGLPWQQGDHILLSDCEHPGVIAIVQEISRRFGVEFSFFPLKDTLNQGDPVAVLAQHLTPQTRLVVVSHLLWNTGQVLPLGDIVKLCHQFPDRPIWVLVDAAQSVGCLPLNLRELEVDFYAFTGHKWLCGPAGVGGLYIRPQSFEHLDPTFIGWRGVMQNEQGYPISYKEDGQRFEVATSDYPLYEGLKSAIAFLQDWGTPQERYERICHLSAYLWQKLSNIAGVSCLKTSPPQAGLVSFQVKNPLYQKELVHSLEKKGFLLRTLADPPCIRACVHYLTLETEIDQLVERLENE